MRGWMAGAAVVLAVSGSAVPATAAGGGQKARRVAPAVRPPADAHADAVKAGVDAWGRGDFGRAVDEWRPRAIAGDADAQFNLGQAYKLGRGVPPDPARARDWFLKAADQGHVQAADNYGLALFEDGRKADAAPWLEKSAARGEPRAQLVLGTMLFNGDGVTRDYPRAYALMTRASQQGLKSAAETLTQMDQYIGAADRQQGIEMARRLAADQTAARVADAGGRSAVPAAGTRRPPDAAAAPRPAPPPPAPPPHPSSPSTPSPSIPSPSPTPRGPVAAVVRPSPPTPAPARPVPAPASRSGGGWRVQLGAFRDAANARARWKAVGAGVGGSPAYVAAGGITRLQAGPFASKAAAQRACAAARGGCVVVAP